MTYSLLVNDATGALLSGGSVAPTPTAGQVVLSIADKPDLRTTVWDPATRTFVARPVRTFVDRLDDVEAWLTNAVTGDPDFLLAWNTLSAANKTRVRTGIRRQLVRLLGGKRMRIAGEAPELES